MPSSSTKTATATASASSFFAAKKSHILQSLATPLSTYSDKSPKGSVDSDIVDLIALINSFPGYVTTSSCAGRVAVFVEGYKSAPLSIPVPLPRRGDGEVEESIEEKGQEDQERSNRSGVKRGRGSGPGPGGKGAGNRWLFVSHERVALRDGDADGVVGARKGPGTGIGSGAVNGTEQDDSICNGTEQSTAPRTFHDLFKLTPQDGNLPLNGTVTSEEQEQEQHQRYLTYSNVRLVKLSFSPLILHILCSSLRTAQPLLAAAINAGFRESGVQSLKALDDEDAGAMVAIRTVGLAFETVVGWVDEQQEEHQHHCQERERQAEGSQEESDINNEIYRSCVSEAVLRMFVGVANDRFGWNEQRRERLRTLLLAIAGNEGEKEHGTREVGCADRSKGSSEWEDRAMRRERKRKEGLERKKEKENSATNGKLHGHAEEEEERATDIYILDDTDAILFEDAL